MSARTVAGLVRVCGLARTAHQTRPGRTRMPGTPPASAQALGPRPALPNPTGRVAAHLRHPRPGGLKAAHRKTQKTPTCWFFFWDYGYYGAFPMRLRGDCDPIRGLRSTLEAAKSPLRAGL